MVYRVNGELRECIKLAIGFEWVSYLMDMHAHRVFVLIPKSTSLPTFRAMSVNQKESVHL
ncbi:hypothetical protein PTI98_002884 [Pleurotus ostreatus]|nr:hypothetical protein PTI98_002884 [Pleurotus ostreatus]